MIAYRDGVARGGRHQQDRNRGSIDDVARRLSEMGGIGLIIAASSQHDEFSRVVAGPTADLLSRTSLDQVRINVLPGRSACLGEPLKRLACLATQKLPFDRIGSPSSWLVQRRGHAPTLRGHQGRLRRAHAEEGSRIAPTDRCTLQRRHPGTTALPGPLRPVKLNRVMPASFVAARWPFQRATVTKETDLMSVCSSQLRRTAAVLALRAAPMGRASASAVPLASPFSKSPSMVPI
jgi:hypothetical protein